MIFIWIFIFFLTEKIELSEGKKGFGDGKQDWGYITVRPGAHMFWWLYYVNPPQLNNSAEFNVFDKPLLIWLQGGPGFSSTGLGSFEELGPLDVNLVRRNYTWINYYNILFIDNPVGVGFSYVENESLYAESTTQIAKDLVECINQFLIIIPKFKNVPTYILGQSYGGKMAVEFSILWYKIQESGIIESNLKGIALGNSWISPIDSVLSYAPYLLYSGFIDTRDYNNIKTISNLIKNATINNEWLKASKLFKFLLYAIDKNIDLYYIVREKQLTDENHVYRYQTAFGSRQPLQKSSLIFANKIEKIMNNKVKHALNLKNSWTFCSRKVKNALTADLMKPVTHIVERILNETDLKVFVYNGQYDFMVPIHGTATWVENLKWPGADDWKISPRMPFIVDNIVEGFVKEHKNLRMYWINRAGHMVPKCNPYATTALLQELTSNNSSKSKTRVHQSFFSFVDQ